jgi:hypothetical protein
MKYKSQKVAYWFFADLYAASQSANYIWFYHGICAHWL